MSDDLLTTLRFEVDGSGIATGLTSVKRSITDLGNAVKGITDKTNAALGKVGTEELPVAKGLEKASKSIIKQTGDIEKAIATFGTTASTSLKQAYKDINAEEVRLRGMGIDAAIMNPYIEKLREVQKLTAAVAAQERTLAQGAAQAVEAENQRLAHTLELKRQIANVKTTVDKNNAAAQAARQAEIEAQQKIKLLDINNKIQAAQRAAADAQSAQSAQKAAQQAEAKAQHQMRLLALNNQIQASNKATADAQAAQSAKAIKDLKDLTAAQAAYRQEVINSELNFTHTGRGKSTAFLADKGQRLGFDSAFIEKELAGYKKVEDAAKAAFQAANPHIAEMSKRAADAGTSVKGLSASLRNVPAQFTDIIVSLQGGQAPLTVLLQQGGQLKDMFGGVGNAARALGGYVVGLINPFTVAAGVVGTLGLAYIKGAAEGEAYNKALITTGNAAGVTAGQLGNMAKAVAQATGGTVGAAAEALAGLAGTSGIAASQFEKIAAVAVQMEKVTGVAVADTVKQFAELGKDPVGASLKLTESTKYLTAEVYEQIRALVEQGKTLEAGAVAQNAFIESSNSRMPELKENLGIVQKLWLSITGAIKGAGDAVNEIGRDKSLEDQITAINNKLAGKTARSNYWDGGKALDAELVTLQRMLASQKSAAFYRAEKIKQEEASIRLSETAYKNEKDRTVLMERERAKVKADYEASKKSLRDTENYEKAIAQIKERYKEKAISTTKTKSGDEFASQRDAAKEWAGYMERFGSMTAKSTAEVDGLNKAQAELVKYLSSTAYTQMDEPARQLALQSAYAAIAIEQQADATKALNKAQEAIEKERTSAILSHAKEIDSINDKAQKLEDEVALYGQSKEAIEALTTARMLDRIEILKGFDGSSEEIARIEETIAARKRLAAAGAAKDQKDANKKAAEDAAKEWQKTADKINDAITDALMRGFENGKGFAENLRDTVVNMFKTMVLRPVVQATVSGGLQALGLPGAGAPGSGLLNTAGNLGSLYGTFAGATSGASFGSLVGANAVQALGGDGLGALIQANNGWAGVNAAGSAAAPGMFASAGPIAAFAVAAVTLGGLLEDLSKRKYVQSTGDAALDFGSSGSVLNRSDFGVRKYTMQDEAGNAFDYEYSDTHNYKVNINKAADDFVVNLNKEYIKAAKTLDLKAVASSFAFGSNDSDGGKFRISGAAGGQSFDSGEIAQTPEALQLAASRAVFAAVQGSELPKYLSGVFDGLTASTATQEQITLAMTAAQALKGFYDQLQASPFEYLQDMSYKATQSLIELSGGLDKLQSNLSTYYDNYYSAEEKRAQTVKNITKRLNEGGINVTEDQVGKARREDLRKLMESIQQALDPEQAAPMVAALLEVNTAFASITQASEKATDAIVSQTDALKEQAAAAATLTANKVSVEVSKAKIAGATDPYTALTSARAGLEAVVQSILTEGIKAGATNTATWTRADIEDAKPEDFAHMGQEVTTLVSELSKQYWSAKETLAGAQSGVSGASSRTEADLALVKSALQQEQSQLTAVVEAFKAFGVAKGFQGTENYTVENMDAFDLSTLPKDLPTDLADAIKGYFKKFYEEVADVSAAQALVNATAAKPLTPPAEAETAIPTTPAASSDKALRERENLQEQYDRLTMTGTELLKKQRDALEGVNHALFDSIQLELAKDQKESLQDRLAVVMGTKTQRQISMEKELEGALDATNAALIKQIYAEEDAAAHRAKVEQERNGLQAQYDQLTLTSTQLLEKQREALDSTNRALFDSIQLETKRKAVAEQAGSFADRLAIATGTSTALEISRKNELATALDDNNKATLLAIYAAEDLKTANESAAAAAKALADTNKGWQDQLDVLTGAQTDRSIALRDALDESTRALMRQVYAQQDLKSAVEASATASDTALGGIQKALDAQKAAQTQAVNDVEGLFDLLSQSVKDLYGQVDSTRAQYAAEGSAFIATAAALAKAGGALPDEAKLRDAIGAARGGIDATQFASQKDADFARLALAGQLSQIQDVAGTKLTDAQALLETTNNAYETAKAQLDTLRGINDSTLSVAAAVEAFQVAFTGEQTARQRLAEGAQKSATQDAGRGPYNPNYESDMRAYALVNLQSKRDQINLLSPIVGMGELVGQLQNEITTINASLGVVPRLATGTNYVPQNGLHYLHEGEAVVPKAYNPAAGGGSNTARLEALVEVLTEKVARLESVIAIGNANTRRTAEVLDNVTEGGSNMRTVAA